MKQSIRILNLYLRKFVLIAFLCLPLSMMVAQSKSITRLGIVNPTPSNMRNVMNLISKQYITAENLEIIGIYHETQTSSIKATKQFFADNGYDKISLKIIEGELLKEDLFKKNKCTTQFEEVFAHTDALIFLGGDDIPPSIYHEETFLTTAHIHSGKNWELSFMHHLIGGSQSDILPLLLNKPEYTILGICLGMQEMNVASGGSLYQDIPFQIYGRMTYEGILRIEPENIHKNYNNKIDNEKNYTSIHFHPIIISEGSFLDFEGVDKNPVVPSLHHQSAKDVASSFEVVATSMDGKVVEALQHTQFKNVYGIQFHTDFSVLHDKGKEFVISPQETIILDENTHKFFTKFWLDFSKRFK